MAEREVRMIDIFDVKEGVEVTVRPTAGRAGNTLWINVDGVCRLRISGITSDQLVISDNHV